MWDTLKTLIRRFEGLRLRPYLCPAGVPTVGYGATFYPDGRRVALQDAPITPEQAEALLDETVEPFALSAYRLSPGLCLESERKHAAIADFCFNLGTTRYKASTLKRRVDAGDWHGAAEELQKWVWGGGKKLPGLVARRKAEAVLLVQN